MSISDFNQRRADLISLARAMQDPAWCRQFIQAYQEDTSFLMSDIKNREIRLPASVLQLAGKPNPYTSPFMMDYKSRIPVGKTAIVLPKNALGITMCKAVSSAYLMNNEIVVRMSRRLKRSYPVYNRLLTSHLTDLSLADPDQSSREFLYGCFLDPEITTVVIYGDDHWLYEYRDVAEKSGTTVLFEGPGNDPHIIYPDCDLMDAVDASIRCGLNNGGQSCSAFERFFVHEQILESYVRLLVQRLSRIRIGPPDDHRARLGPIRSRRVLSRIKKQILQAENKGARLVCGGGVLDLNPRDFQFCQPTVLTGCTPDMAVVKDETFGPVFPILSFDDPDALISMLDCVDYGLNATIHGTPHPDVACYVEGSHRNFYYNSTAVCPVNIPSRILDGGYKRSGIIWRMVNGHYREYTGRRYLAKELSLPAGRLFKNAS